MKYCDIEAAVSSYFHKYQQSELRQGKLCEDMRVSMSMSPAYWIGKDGTEGGMSCDTYTYHLFEKDGIFQCEVEVKRMEARCKSYPAGISITDFQWDTIQVMNPVHYENENPFSNLGTYGSLPAGQVGNEEDYLAIRNLQNIFYEHRLHQAGDLFCTVADPEFKADCMGMECVRGKNNIVRAFSEYLEKEKENQHCYLFLGVTGMPLIETNESGDQARGLFMTQIYKVKAGLYDPDVDHWRMERTMALTDSGYVKENGEWKIRSMEIRNLVKLPDTPYRNDGRYDKSGMSREPWSVDQIRRTQPEPEIAMHIENMINGWAYACRRGELPEYIDKNMKNPLGKNRMLIRSFGAKTPELMDYEAIVRKITDMTNQYRDRYYTFHAPTTPVITLDTETGVIRGTWYDTAATNLRGMAESTEHIPYMTFVNKYVHKFEKIEGKWYLTDFYNEPMLSLQDWDFDMDHSRGYINSSECGKYPERFMMKEDKE